MKTKNEMKHTPTRKVTWDGQGINDTDEYAPRIAKFQSQYLHLGPQIVNAVNCHEELLESLRECVQLMGENVNYQEDKDFKLAVDSACNAIAKAEGR